MTVTLFQGTIGAIPLAFILPALCYIKLESGPVWSRQKMPAVAIAAFGTVISALSILRMVVMASIRGRLNVCDSASDFAYDFIHDFHASQIGVQFFI
jgi:hypothetical protein